MLIKINPTLHPTTTKTYQDLPITILSHSPMVYCQLHHPITPTRSEEPLDLSETRT